MGRRGRHSSSSVSKRETPAFFLLYGSVSGFIGCICIVVAGGVGLHTPFNVLAIIPLIIGIIGIVLTVAIVIVTILFMGGMDEIPWFLVVYYICRFLYGIVNLISFPVGIVFAVGLLSLQTSLDVLPAIPQKEVGYSYPAVDWIGKTSVDMSSAGVSLIMGFAAVIVPIICYLAGSKDDNYTKTEHLDALAIAVVHLLCGLLLFLPLQRFGRTGVVPFGFAGLKDSTYVGLYVLGIIVIALAGVNIVLVGVNLILPISLVFRILGVVGCVVSVPILVYASIVLAERTKVETNLKAFCMTDEGPSAHCSELLTRFKSNMCFGRSAEGHGGGGAEGDGEGEGEEEGEEEEEVPCEDQYTMEVLQGKMTASMRDWMGYMGFACMFLAFVHVGVCLLVGLCNKSAEPVWPVAGIGDLTDFFTRHDDNPSLSITLGNKELKTKVVGTATLETILYGESFVFDDVDAEYDEVRFDMYSFSGRNLAGAAIRLSQYTDTGNGKQRTSIAMKEKDIQGVIGDVDAGVLDVDVEVHVKAEPKGKFRAVFFVDKFTKLGG